MKRAFFILLLCITVNHGFSQDYSQTIKGKVIDRDSKEALIGASVVILNTDPLYGTITDVNGNFRLEKVKTGRQSLQIKYIGYKDLILPEINVTTGKEIVLNIELTQSVIQVRGVQISASQQDRDKSLNTMATISSRKLNMEDAQRYAGGFNDAARMVSSFAGVSAVEADGVNDIIIRGNSPRGLLWRLEGIEIPNPNHFTDGQGGSGGAFSVITSNVLSNSDFLTGAFPAEYGNAYSGIMDLYLRKGNEEKREYAFQLSVVGTEISMEGPFSKSSKASYLLNYRYSTFGLLSQMKLIDLGDNNLPPVFQDLTLNVSLPTKKAGNFNFFMVGGKSTTGTDPVKDSSQWVKREGRFFETEDHAMAFTGIKHFYLFPGNKTYLKTLVGATFQGDQWKSGLLNQDYSKFTEYHDDFRYPSLRGSMVLNSKLSAKNVIRAGVIFSGMQYNMFMKEYDYDEMKYDTLVDKVGNTNMLQSFVHWKHRISDGLEVNSGLHFLTYALTGRSSLEPRLGVRWTIDRKSTLNAGIGLHSRTEAIPVYLAMVPGDNGILSPANDKLGFAKATHYVAGYDYSISDEWRLKAEVYYQNLFDIPVEDKANSTISALNYIYGIPDIHLVNQGKGYNYGAEFTLEKFYTSDFYLLATLSVFDSRFRANDGKWHNTVFNSRYVANFLTGRDFKLGKNKQNILGVNLKGFLRGGYRISPVDRAASLAAHDIIYDEEHIYSDQLPAFSRIDLGSYLRINKNRYSYIVSIDIQNITNRKNVMGYEYSDKVNDIVETESMGIVPIINFRIEM
ncbi:MAG: carboxypeptidase-like regulatory domain-containing protein [Bacteroidales bacterium]